MRILHVVPTYLPATRYGGPIYSVHALCRHLAERGHDVHVYTTNVDGPGMSDVPLLTAVERDGVKVWYFPTGHGRRLYRSPAMGAALGTTVAEFDIVHLHSVFLWPTSAAAAAARRTEVPYLIAPRGMLVADLIQRKSCMLKRAWICAFERRNLAEAAAIHVTSQIEAEELAALGFKTRRVAVIANGIDVPELPRPSDPSWLPKSVGRPRILALGRINWKKGLHRLIPALAQVADAHLLIAGNDEDTYQPKLDALAKAHGVSSRTHFLGPVHGERKWELLTSTDIFVLPSYSENFGISVLEAMSCGIPVVVTPEVGLASTVSNVGAGLVVDGDPQAIGTAISRLLADPALRKRMGAAGERVAREQFSWASIAAQMENVYLSCSVRSQELGPTSAKTN